MHCAGSSIPTSHPPCISVPKSVLLNVRKYGEKEENAQLLTFLTLVFFSSEQTPYAKEIFPIILRWDFPIALNYKVNLCTLPTERTQHALYFPMK